MFPLDWLEGDAIFPLQRLEVEYQTADGFAVLAMQLAFRAGAALNYFHQRRVLKIENERRIKGLHEVRLEPRYLGGLAQTRKRPRLDG